MNNVLHVINNMVSFSQFNKGMAGKIFNEVKKTGLKIVVKNNAPECILMSPAYYMALIDMVDKAKHILEKNEQCEQIKQNEESDLIKNKTTE